MCSGQQSHLPEGSSSLLSLRKQYLACSWEESCFRLMPGCVEYLLNNGKNQSNIQCFLGHTHAELGCHKIQCFLGYTYAELGCHKTSLNSQLCSARRISKAREQDSGDRSQLSYPHSPGLLTTAAKNRSTWVLF